MTQHVLHPANSRGFADHGWLNSRHTFSFATYHNPERVHFGALRVINDDSVAAGGGFGTHPHQDMEIISIPLSGDLRHRDSMGNEGVIRHGDVQVMSAGTGIRHSEMNANADRAVQFLQIWVFPRENGVTPRYGQLRIADGKRKNEFQQILSPNPDDAGVWIHQDAWFHLADFEAGTTRSYALKKAGDGLYAFVIRGKAKIGGFDLGPRDGLGLWETDAIEVSATEDAEILLMEVPMQIG